MRLGDLGHNRESEAGPAGAGRVAVLEDLVALVRGNPRPVVRDRETALAGLDGCRRVSTGVADRVPEERRGAVPFVALGPVQRRPAGRREQSRELHVGGRQVALVATADRVQSVVAQRDGYDRPDAVFHLGETLADVGADGRLVGVDGTDVSCRSAIARRPIIAVLS